MLNKDIYIFNKISEKKLLIGLTGICGSGKSLALSYFKELGALTISSDEISSNLLTNKKCYCKILEVFKEDVFENKKINKTKLAKIIFKNVKKRKILENILWPFILDEIKNTILKSTKNIVIIEAPLLFESGFDKYVTLNINISTNENIFKRVKNRNWTLKELNKRIKAQFSQEKKEKLSDIIIENNLKKEELKEKIKTIYEIFKKITGRK